MENEPSRENFPFSHRTSCVHVGGRENVCLSFHKLAAPRMFSLDGFKSSLESARRAHGIIKSRLDNKVYAIFDILFKFHGLIETDSSARWP